MGEDPDSISLGELGEEALVERLTGLLPGSAELVIGPGDDCAAVDLGDGRLLLLKTDCLVEGVHFTPDTEGELVGRKAINRVLSDIAAMGGCPGHALVTLASHAERPVAQVEAWYRGMVAAAAAVGCTIAGGETATLPHEGAVISVAMTGYASSERCIRRCGAEPGHVIAVTGRLGGSFRSGRHLTFAPRLEEAQWLAQHFPPSSMMDLSDGLGSDLPRLVKASKLGYHVLSELLPLYEDATVDEAISDGEDYELLMTLPPDVFTAAVIAWCESFPNVNLTRIGEVTEKTRSPLARGWEHYRQR